MRMAENWAKKNCFLIFFTFQMWHIAMKCRISKRAKNKQLSGICIYSKCLIALHATYMEHGTRYTIHDSPVHTYRLRMDGEERNLNNFERL